MEQTQDKGPKPFVVDIEDITLSNENYRTTLWTGKNMQLTVMTIQSGHDIGLEVHDDHDQFLRIEQGEATVLMGETKDSLTKWIAIADYAVFVPAGTWHNLINNSDVELKLYSIYAPPEHPHGTIHHTKEDADRDETN